jgi:hypothetical protein
MILVPNILKKSATATTYITFNDYPTDTLQVEEKNTKRGILVTKVWYNQELKWDYNGVKGKYEKYNIWFTRRFKITKHVASK